MSDANTVTISIKDWEDLKKYKKTWEKEAIEIDQYGHLYSGYRIITNSEEIQKEINSIKDYYKNKLEDQKDTINNQKKVIKHYIERECYLDEEINKLQEYKNMSMWQFFKNKFNLTIYGKSSKGTSKLK